jgi:hypothetical protein
MMGYDVLKRIRVFSNDSAWKRILERIRWSSVSYNSSAEKAKVLLEGKLPCFAEYRLFKYVEKTVTGTKKEEFFFLEKKRRHWFGWKVVDRPFENEEEARRWIISQQETVVHVQQIPL